MKNLKPNFLALVWFCNLLVQTHQNTPVKGLSWRESEDDFNQAATEEDLASSMYILTHYNRKDYSVQGEKKHL